MARLSEARYYRRICEDLMKNSDISKKDAVAFALREHMRDMEWKDLIDEQWNNRYNKSSFEKGWFFLTIRPHNDFKDFHKFKQLATTIVKRKMIEKFNLVFEQKGENKFEIGKGFHFHALIKLKSPQKGKKYFINEFIKDVYKEKLSDVIASNCIDLKPINDEISYDTRIRYMNTDEFHKGDKNKKIAWENDKIWRKSKHLKDAYTSWEELSNNFAPPLPSLLKSIGDDNNSK